MREIMNSSYAESNAQTDMRFTEISPAASVSTYYKRLERSNGHRGTVGNKSQISANDLAHSQSMMSASSP